MQQQGMYRECPHCREQMRRDASVCPHCRRESAAWQLHEGRWWVQTDGKWFYLDEKANRWVASEQRQPVAAGPGPSSSLLGPAMFALAAVTVLVLVIVFTVMDPLSNGGSNGGSAR